MMKTKLAIIGLLAGLLTLPSCDNKMGGAPSMGGDPQSETDKTLYALGMMMGSRLKELEMNETEVGMVLSGAQDAALGRDPKASTEDYGSKIQEFMRSRVAKRAEKGKKEGAEYLQKFLGDKGAQKTKSGLGYKILEMGSGDHPKSKDVVEVHYTGTLMDGTVFDSSRERNKPVTFPLRNVIKGWSEGITMIKKGGKIKLVIPSDLAYGDHGAPPKIPGGATLIFDVELLNINPKPKPQPTTDKGKAKGKGKKK